MRREFLQLAHTYRPDKDNVAGWFMSAKLDGSRCLWDGGLSRGVPTREVPWASIQDPKKPCTLKAKIKPTATGLWSRYGNPIMAPDWFLNQLPCCLLDGELWAGEGKFQLCRSICAGDEPDPRFNQISYAVYSSPPLAALFGTGEIKNANMHQSLDFIAIEHWIRNRLDRFQGDFRYLLPGQTFSEELSFLAKNLDICSNCYLHLQTKVQSSSHLEDFLQKVLDKGGEGVVLRDPNSTWTPKRHRGILKWKPFDDDEGTVTGFTSGRMTDKGSKHLGRIGALILDFGGKRLELSGLTDEERVFKTSEMTTYAALNPGENMPDDFEGNHFKVGQVVTFKYRELSDGGLPKEARYFRKRDEE